jgi:mono/diheme cytochrome c family protein
MPKMDSNKVYDLELDNAVEYAKKLNSGLAVYAANCAICHGRMPPFMFKSIGSVEELQKKIGPGSVPYDRLPKTHAHFPRRFGDTELEDLARYFQARVK